jgi:chromosome segregation ATPase
MAEIQADKDQLRAEFAMSARRLEMSVEQLKNKTTSQLAELGKKTDAINRMKIELGEKNATIFSLEARERAVKEQLRATEEEFAAKTEMLRSAEHALNDKQAELGKINHELSDRSMTADSRQVELIAVRTQIEQLPGASAMPKGIYGDAIAARPERAESGERHARTGGSAPAAWKI